MGSYKHFSFLIIFIILNHSYGLLQNEEKAASKLIAQEDTTLLLETLHAMGEDYGKSWLVMPDGNGTAQLAVLQSQRSTSGSSKIVTTTYNLKDMYKHVILYSYTKEEPDGKVIEIDAIQESGLDPNKTTKVIVHGWMASSDSSVITGIRDAYLENQDVNVIGVDWNYISKDFIYPNAAAATSVVGEYVGTLIDSMVEKLGARHDDFHVIGHSLGAHVAGFAGSKAKKKIGRITGLDPALPGFQYVKGPDERLDPTDATFVDIIHTCAGILGMSILTGHADFYPNGGSPFQPGCCEINFPTGTQACSHSRSHEFFAESIRHPDFKAIECKDWDHFKRNHCENEYTYMGENVSRKAKGAFYLKTNTNPPFALGLNGTLF